MVFAGRSTNVEASIVPKLRQGTRHGSYGAVVNHDQAGPARLMRLIDGHWRAIGDPMPPLADDDMHADDRAGVVYWTLPVQLGAGRGDRLLWRDRAWSLLDQCGPNHRATCRLAEHMHASYDTEFAADWLARRQVWALRPV